MLLSIEKDWFVDEKGRRVLLRGVNLGGDSKVPYTPNGATHIKADFENHRDISFVGRPFPLNEANNHFKRLKHWGFNIFRLLITWEAIEHKGPKIYDKEYLDYISELLKIAEEYKLYCFIDPHQDVWSRMTGGDGAPGWTFEKVGLNFRKFDRSDAAFVMQHRYLPNNPNSYPLMHWQGNAYRFANGTMWTLFLGGRDFAPSCRIDGISAQDYLQTHFFNAFKQIAKYVKDNPYVLGFNTLNEPLQGWIELRVDGSNMPNFSDILGYAFTPLDAMAIGSGYSRIIGYREIKRFGIRETKKEEINKEGISCWLEGYEDIWKKNGVWGLDENQKPIILNNDYFLYVHNNQVNFYKDYLSPFIKEYSTAIREIFPDAILFFEGSAEKLMRGESFELDLPTNIVHEAHWYDVATLGTQKPMLKANFDIVTNKPVIGKTNVQNLFIRQLHLIKESSSKIQGGIPTLIGEFGLPYNLNNKEAYKKYELDPLDAWKIHIKALNMYYNALDANLLHSTQWNYTADNTNEWGDQWNLEDLSIFSKDQQQEPKNINSGGRAIEGFCRPHFIYCAGKPLKMEFNLKKGVFKFEFESISLIKAPTVIYVPKIHYPNGFNIELSQGHLLKTEDEQLAFFETNYDGICSVTISKL